MCKPMRQLELNIRVIPMNPFLVIALQEDVRAALIKLVDELLETSDAGGDHRLARQQLQRLALAAAVIAPDDVINACCWV